MDCEERSDTLRRRASKLARKGEFRKAALALRERAALVSDAPAWVLVGHMMSRARRTDDAVAAYRQGMWLHQQAGARGRARTVARLITDLSPYDRAALKLAS